MERVWSTSRGGFSVRSIFLFAITALTAALLWTASFAQNAYAAEVFWKGESITYDTRQYFPAEPASAGESHGLPVDTPYYVSVENVSVQPLVRKAHVIYFAPGSDPPTETSATYVAYDYSADEEFSNPTGRTTVTATPQGTGGDEEAYSSSCTVEGIGWIICPVTVWLANSMDWIYEQIAYMVEVPPIPVNTTDTPLYTAWNIMRSFANVAFIVMFLIIIYSQLTTLGVSSFGIKKLLPRLIVAAVLVNISFYIVALAVDLSNLAGYGLQQIMINLREQTFSITGDSLSGIQYNWGDIAAFVLSGGAIAGAFVSLSVASGGSIVALAFMLIPVLLGLAVSILVVLLILAARQAIIVILIVLAPLAFVAYLLPNTEKWFDKWKDLLMTMLVFFPAFSLAFGGAQLAGGIIIQNAHTVMMVIFGMAVQVAPLIITPMLLKLSGGLLGRIAGMVNNPAKGMLDGAKNWSKDNAAMHRARSMADQRRFSSLNPMRGTARFLDGRKRNQKKATELYEQMAETRYMDKNKGYANLEHKAHDAHMDREMVDTRHKRQMQEHINDVTSASHLKNIQVEAGKLALEHATQVTAANTSEYRAGSLPEGASATVMQPFANRMMHDHEATQVHKLRQTSAEHVGAHAYAERVEASKDLQALAGGIDTRGGAERALANALAAQTRARDELIGNASSILSHYNYDSKTTNDIALGKQNIEGVNFTITEDVRLAAMKKIAGGANTDEIMRLMADIEINPSAENQDFRQMFYETLIANGNKPKFAGAAILENMGQGTLPTDAAGVPLTGKARLDDFIAQTVNGNKLGVTELVSQDKTYLKQVVDSINNNTSNTPVSDAAKQVLANRLFEATNDPLHRGSIGDRKEALEKMQGVLPPPDPSDPAVAKLMSNLGGGTTPPPATP